MPNDNVLTDDLRTVLQDAARSLSLRADELRESNTAIDGTWCDADEKAAYDAEVRLVERLRAILATQQPEPRASASFIAAAIAVIKAARAHVLTDEHIDALDIAIKIQQGMFKVPEPRDEVTDERIARLREAIEGECDGLAVDYHHARAILEYVDGDAAGTGAAS
ncbi:hypothetical protein [Burkholderia multivorans]|uniref:hypothetical protein n=1 Tax=Burkholderia multivorans TaxID=87883 RepID=UPI00143EB61E|nr:hypothetical protein [Burkholderia multivorans]QIX16387.1 hypothetical protein FOB32_16340 [Burkholderia multivorans]